MLKFTLRFQFLFLLLVVLCAQFAAAQQTIPQQIITKYDSIRNVAPREKLYIHFDSNIYTQRDTIWFKAYLVNATLNNQSSLSALIYAELINANGDVVDILSLPTTLGLTWGAFALKEDKYPAGNYTFRAYTNWMKNFGNTYIFQREIKVLSTEVKSKTEQNAKVTAEIVTRQQRTITKASREIDIQFLPEGGNWVADVFQKMAFKAINNAGKGTVISGEVFDSSQNKVAEFTSNNKGMGCFSMVPKANETYTAKIRTPAGEIIKNLPNPLLSGTTLQLVTKYASDSLRIMLTSNLIDEELTVIGQSKGVVCFVVVVRPNVKTRIIQLKKDVFPTGVSQIILMNSKKQLLNERNFFLNLNDQLKINTTTPALTFGVRDSIPIALKVTDYLGKPVAASFSVAITDDGQVLKDSVNDANILSYLLMTSDLKGEIESPGYYFHQPNEQTNQDLDLLMLTQGWVSYHWEGDKKSIVSAEKEYTISGKVDNVLNKPSVGGKVTLLGKNKSFMLIDTVTNAKGEFVFDQLPVLDSASFVIQAKNSKGKNGTLGITVNEFVRPLFSLPVQNKNIEIEQPLDSIAAKFIATKNEAYQMALKSGIILREVKIVGKRSIKGSKNLNGPGQANQILGDIELEPLAKKTLYQVLMEKIKGFREGFRPKTNIKDFFINSDLARFVIDGMDVDFFYSSTGIMENSEYYYYIRSYLDYYNAEDVTGIETMQNGNSFAYKNRFKDPLDPNTYAFIEITTKSGVGPFLKKRANMYMIKPVNYGNTKVFYEPKYTVANKADKKPDFRSTLYWNPNVLANEDGIANFSFFSADKKGSYTVWIEGTDTEGGLGMKVMKVVIK